MALTSGEQQAIRKALAHGGAAAVRRVRYGVYTVASASRPDVVHTVTIDATGAYGCTCEAGAHGKPCWHAAGVFIAKVEHASRGRGRVTRPAGPVGASGPVPTAPANPRPTRPAAALTALTALTALPQAA